MNVVNDDQPSPQAIRAQRAREQAVSLYPLETWREIEERVFIAESREPRSNNQEKVLAKELIQAHILTGQGSTVYLLPESVDPARDGVKHPDAIVDGSVVEFKTITGKVRQIEEHFKESRKKANIVFFKIDSPLSKEAVIKKLEGVILQKGYHGGQVIAYFSETAQLYYWDIDDLR